MNALFAKFGRGIAGYLSRPVRQGTQVATHSHEFLAATLRPGDVLLVEGNARISVAIKYLTQSTWSHAALFVGERALPQAPGAEPRVLVEADIAEGVRAVPLSAFRGMHTRICRPLGLAPEDLRKVIAYCVAAIGHRYDLKNVIDLARYLLPTPPVPVRWRRRMLAFGSGDPSRAICSTLIAQAFQSVRYPILPEITREKSDACEDCYREILHIRHFSLYTPRDFDISPYFEVVKPSIARGFDYRKLEWADRSAAVAAGTG
ncbi:MAG: YiiX/YebB-like N1pC/P60 family cysteine hydrolase [Burkholderiales bacterium]